MTTVTIEGDISRSAGWSRTAAGGQGRFRQAGRFYVRLNNKTRAIDDNRVRERYFAQRWGGV